MTPNSELLVDLIFQKLKNYKNKKIFLEKENLKKFIFSLLKEEWIQWKIYKTSYSKYQDINITLNNLSFLTIFLIIIFIVSLFALYKVTSNNN